MKTGLIGHGYWGKILLSNLEKLSEVKFVCNSKTPYIQKLNGVDWVFIATPNDTHYDIVKTCLLSGKNVFCEKPLAPTYEECVKLYELADIMGVKLYVDDVFNYRDEKELIDFTQKDIEVVWNNPNNTDYKNLMYHDLYLLYPLLKDNVTVDMPYINGIKFTYGITDTKEHYVAGVDFTHKPDTKDALYEMVKKVLDNKVDYTYNKVITLNCSKILEQVTDETL